MQPWIGIGIAIAIGNRNHGACENPESPGSLVLACKTDGDSDCDPDADSDLTLPYAARRNGGAHV